MVSILVLYTKAPQFLMDILQDVGLLGLFITGIHIGVRAIANGTSDVS